MAKTNLSLIQRGRELLRRARQQRTIEFVHVKGHSGDPGNDRADELVQWGKLESSEYARFREDGTGEGASRMEPVADYDGMKEARMRAIENRLAEESRARQEVRRRLAERRDRLVAAQQEAMAVDVNHVDEEGFAIFDRNSFLSN